MFNGDKSPESSQGRPDILFATAWQRVCRRLRSELGEDVFTSWFGRLELDAVNQAQANVSVPTKFLRSWLQSHYTDRLQAAIASEWPNVSQVQINIRTATRAIAARPPAATSNTLLPAAPGLSETPAPRFIPAVPAAFAAAPRQPEALPEDNEALAGSPLDRRLTFQAFLVGRSNQLAHAAAQQVAHARPGSPLPYNPLYIHAAVGLGKTHVLQAIAHAAQEVQRRVIYLTAEKFMYGFVAALKSQSAIAFKEKLRGIDVLIIGKMTKGAAIAVPAMHISHLERTQ